ncbi:hypothetical protein HPB51_029211 [Rhipicephalus microplus]|uniref:Uncharacterized protein n=1 Tax=Rhipicephalus microplus TaxID=6941 RepID=A0A9J6CVI0_RHIMP|nr:hypothetical protein HPB51_029211 [Rhipicephalus microplus]
MSAMSVLDLVKCHDASMLLGAFNMHCMQEVGDEDGEIRDLFFAPGTKRLELLRWVLIAIDPSGKHARELNTGDDCTEESLTKVLSYLNPRRVKEFAAFVRGTAPVREQKVIWELLLGTADFVQNTPEDESSGFSTASWSTAMTFKPTVASTPMPQVGGCYRWPTLPSSEPSFRVSLSSVQLLSSCVYRLRCHLRDAVIVPTKPPFLFLYRIADIPLGQTAEGGGGGRAHAFTS